MNCRLASSVRDSCWRRASYVAGTSVCRPHFYCPDWILSSSVAFSLLARDSNSLSRHRIGPEQAYDVAISFSYVSRSACRPSSCAARSVSSRWLSYLRFWQYNRNRLCNLSVIWQMENDKKRNILLIWEKTFKHLTSENRSRLCSCVWELIREAWCRACSIRLWKRNRYSAQYWENDRHYRIPGCPNREKSRCRCNRARRSRTDRSRRRHPGRYRCPTVNRCNLRSRSDRCPTGCPFPFRIRSSRRICPSSRSAWCRPRMSARYVSPRTPRSCCCWLVVAKIEESWVEGPIPM